MVIAASVTTYVLVGTSISTTNVATTIITATSIQARTEGEARRTNAVNRICSPRRNATAAPNMFNQRKRVVASSSTQYKGRWNTYRATTPISSRTNSSHQKDGRRHLRRPAQDLICSTCPPPASRKRRDSGYARPDSTLGHRVLLSELTGIACQHRPRGIAVLLLPLLVEARIPELHPEGLRVGRADVHSVPDQRLGEILVEGL